MARVRVGDSVLTRHLVWCECGCGLSLSGKWLYCPSCATLIDQGSYRSAIDQAKLNRASIFYIDPELAEQLVKLLEAAKRGVMALEANGAPNCEAAKELRAAIAKAEGRANA